MFAVGLLKDLLQAMGHDVKWQTKLFKQACDNVRGRVQCRTAHVEVGHSMRRLELIDDLGTCNELAERMKGIVG